MEEPTATSRVQGGKIYVKPLNYIGGLLCAGVGILKYIVIIVNGGGQPIAMYLIPAYFVLFGVIMLASDLNMQKIIENFNFLDIYMGRGLFNIFVSSQIIAVAGTSGAGGLAGVLYYIALIGGWGIFALGIYLIILHFMEKNSSINGNVATSLKMKVAKTVLTQKLTAI